VAFNPSGFDPGASAPGAYPADALRADLAALRPAFDGLILYAFDDRITPAILDHAAVLEYRAALLGIWNPGSDAELAGTAELIRRFAGRLALAVCIGNEGINDNRYGIPDLVAASERLRALSGGIPPVPITTSEPAGDYGWPPLLGFGDFYAPNIHPAIDRDGLDAEAAVAWVHSRAEAIARVGARPVLVKETGLPHGGAAGQSPARQRAFWEAWLARGRFSRIGQPAIFVSHAAAFEAFDAPWKAAKLANHMEGQWGLMSIDRSPYPAFHVWVEAAR
jgi:exo-beta-1,3-glucanase (GH17 family)